MHSYIQADSRQASTQACRQADSRQAGNKALDEKQMHDVTREDTISKVHFLILHTMFLFQSRIRFAMRSERMSSRYTNNPHLSGWVHSRSVDLHEGALRWLKRGMQSGPSKDSLATARTHFANVLVQCSRWEGVKVATSVLDHHVVISKKAAAIDVQKAFRHLLGDHDRLRHLMMPL